MKRILALTTLLLACAGAPLACSGVEGAPPAAAPRNVCSGDFCGSPTANIRCRVGRCEVDLAMDYVLAIELPNTALFAPNSTFLITAADVTRFTRATNSCPLGCLVMPQLAQLEGRYMVALGVAERVGQNLDVAGLATLPARLRIRPLFPYAEGRDGFADAARLGLPVNTIDAVRTLNLDTQAPGPAGGVSVGFTMTTTPLNYEVQVEPDAFVDRYPPLVTVREVAASRDLNVLSASYTLGGSAATDLDREDSRRALISSEGVTLDGFVGAVFDPLSLVRLSGRIPLHGQSGTYTFFTTALGDLGRLGAELWILPPPGTVGLPSLKIPVIPGVFPTPVRYPRLPAPVVVAGTVRADLSTGVRISFESLEVAVTGRDVQPDLLHYTANVTTDSQGRFSTVLPLGTYRVFLDPPLADDNYARTELSSLTIAASSDSLAFGLRKTIAVQGGVQTFDGQAVGDAAVEFVPSPTLRARGTLPPQAWPRPQVVKTSRAGSYVVAVDPGLYDLIITPANGTGYPPVVIHDLTIDVTSTNSSIFLPRIVIPPPSVLHLHMRDPADNPLTPARVRIFIRPLPSVAYVELARGSSDVEGQANVLYTLSVAGSALVPTADGGADTSGADAQ